MKYLIICAFICIYTEGFAQQHGLDYYLQQAKNNSPLLKDYQAQVQANQVDSELITARYKPQVFGSSVNSYSPVIKGWGYDNAITNGANVSALVVVNKTLVGKSNLATQFQSVQLQNQAVQNTAKITEQDLKRTITAQYITAYGGLLQVNFNRQVNDLLKHQEVLLKKQTEQNVYRQTDYLTFLVTLQQQELSLRQLEIQLQNDYATLNYLAGITDTAAFSLQDPGITIEQLPGMYNSVFFKQFELDSLKLNNSKDLVDYSYKPKVNLYADGGYNSSFSYQACKNFGTSFGVNITVPIYDGKQKQMQYSKLAIAERTRQYYKDFFEKQYNQQLAQLMQQLHATDGLLNQINGQIKYAESLITVNGKLLETGDAKIADYVIALNTYLNAKNLLTQNNINRLQIINQINYWNR